MQVFIRIVLLFVLLSMFEPFVSAAQTDSTSRGSVQISIEEPRPGEPVVNIVHQAPIRGSATADGEQLFDIDVIIAIDLSGSTENPSGTDVDRDGYLGFNPDRELVPPGTYPPGTRCTDPGDSILAAEIAAAAALIENLNPLSMRVGVVSFAGNPRTPRKAGRAPQDAWVEVPLTRNFDEARRALQNILARGPNGGTNFAAGIRLAVTELAGLSGAQSETRVGAKKIVMFLSDGVPSLPIGSISEKDPGDVDAALYAARIAHQAGVVINSYGLGRHALADPFAATEISRITLGTFTPVRNPGDVITYLQNVSFALVDDVILTNLTTSEVADDVRLRPDGTFSGFLPVREGTNRVRVTALATDGSQSSVEFDFDFEISGLMKGELELELERIRNQTRSLELAIERDRIKEEIDEQRKSLTIEIEE